MKQTFYSTLLLIVGLTPAFSNTNCCVEQPTCPAPCPVVKPAVPLTLIANNHYGQEVVVHQGPFSTRFTLVDPKHPLPRTPAWDWVQFSMRFDLGNGIVKTACSAYSVGQDAASYDMMIPRNELPYHMQVLVRIHDFGGVPSYDCAVYPNLPVQRLRPRY